MKYPVAWAALFVASGFIVGYFLGYQKGKQRIEVKEKILPVQEKSTGEKGKIPTLENTIPEPSVAGRGDYRGYISVVLSWKRGGVSGTITNLGEQSVSLIELTFYWVDEQNRWTHIGRYQNDFGLKPKESHHFSAPLSLPREAREEKGHYNYELSKLEVQPVPAIPSDEK